MRIDRTVLRTVAPPVLALGLVAALIHPVDALPVPAVAPTGPAAPTTGIAFAERITLSDGRLRTAVGLGRDQRAGTASVVGAPGCRTDLAPGSVARLDCAYAGSGPVTVSVVLKDGTRTSRTAMPTAG